MAGKSKHAIDIANLLYHHRLAGRDRDMKVLRLQILTAAEILDNRRPQVPFGFTEGFRKAGQEKEDRQPKLL